MIKIINRNKKLIISHISDIDGMGSVILSLMEFGDIDYILAEPKETEKIFSDLSLNKIYENYDIIYLTDLPMDKNAAEIIKGIPSLKAKFRHFDHHVVNDELKCYDFINSIIEKEGIKTCATSNFFDYLINEVHSVKLNNNFTRGFVEAIRSADTYDWKENNNWIAKYLVNLYSVLGPLAFIQKFVSELSVSSNKPFELDSISKLIGETVENNIANYINSIDSNMVVINFNGYKFGAFITELYRSEVGNYFSGKYIDTLDFILIYDPYRKAFSLRTEKENIDLSKIAHEFSPKGGGHKKAAGFPLDNSSYWLLNKIIEMQIA